MAYSVKARIFICPRTGCVFRPIMASSYFWRIRDDWPSLSEGVPQKEMKAVR